LRQASAGGRLGTGAEAVENAEQGLALGTRFLDQLAPRFDLSVGTTLERGEPALHVLRGTLVPKCLLAHELVELVLGHLSSVPRRMWPINHRKRHLCVEF
jgi:hypothetical protein